MHQEIAAADAEATLVTAPPGPVGSSYRNRLADALRKGSTAVHGIDRQLLANVLSAPLARTWSTALYTLEVKPSEPFVPMGTVDGWRTFLPVDLREEDEHPLRSFAAVTANPFVCSAIFDVLWVRFGNHADARAAVEARAAAAALVEIDSAWFEVSTEIIRAFQLTIAVGDIVRLRDVVLPSVEEAGRRAAEVSDPGVFVGLASEISIAVLGHPKFIKHAGAHGRRWGVTTLLGAGELLSRGDIHRSEDALVVAAELFSTAKITSAAANVRRTRVAWLLQEGKSSDGMSRAHRIQIALDEAVARGFSDLASVAKLRLRDAVNAATKDMKGISFEIELPTNFATRMSELALRSPTAVAAVRTLAADSSITSMSVAAQTAAAREEAETAVFLHRVPAVHYRDGKIAGLATSSEEKMHEAIGRYASIGLALRETAADAFLSAAFSRFNSETLFLSFGRPAWVDPRRLVWLARASERFAAQDFLSSASIVLSQYEGVLRDLARASGYHATKYDAGVTSDETLNSLLRVPAVRDLLGENHVSFVEYLLCRQEMGPNLRNELAHSNLKADELRPGVVFLIWLVMVRMSEYEAMAREHVESHKDESSRNESEVATDAAAAGGSSDDEPKLEEAETK